MTNERGCNLFSGQKKREQFRKLRCRFVEEEFFEFHLISNNKQKIIFIPPIYGN